MIDTIPPQRTRSHARRWGTKQIALLVLICFRKPTLPARRIRTNLQANHVLSCPGLKRRHESWLQPQPNNALTNRSQPPLPMHFLPNAYLSSGKLCQAPTQTGQYGGSSEHARRIATDLRSLLHTPFHEKSSDLSAELAQGMTSHHRFLINSGSSRPHGNIVAIDRLVQDLLRNLRVGQRNNNNDALRDAAQRTLRPLLFTQSIDRP